MQYLEHTKILCLTYGEFVEPTGIVPKGTYDSAKQRGNIKVHGRGNNGSQVLIEYESLPAKYKKMVVDRYGDPYEYHATQPLLAMLKQDMEARAFYAGYLLPDGRHLPLEYQTKYSRQCDWFNMINLVLADQKALREQLGISVSQFWEKVITLTQADEIDNGLPTSYKRITSRLRLYNNDGYPALISSNFGNQKTRKVNDNIDRLLIALYLMPERPYYKRVCELYAQFIDGALEVFDTQTGEVFNPQDYYVDGEPYKVSEATVKYYIEKPLNRAVVDKHRLSNLQYTMKHRPHFIRKAPQYAFSKITMDDITVPFKMANGKRVWSYQIFDVASQAVIGVSFNRDKSQELVRDSLRDMLRRITRNGWGMPMEVEIEQHLNSGMKGKENEAGVFEADIFTEGALFPFVSFCAARNPQQKRAEGFIRLKKYGFQKNREGFQFRPFARNEANRANEDAKDRFYTYEEIVANEMQDIAAYNNALHSDQDTYPGLTRWEVLEQHLNPALIPANKAAVLPYLGHKVRTSINRGYINLQYRKYKLSDISAMERLTSDKLIAYYLEDEDGNISYVHLYDGNENPICEAVEVEAYQEATQERTAEDAKMRGRQAAYINKFDSMVKDKAATIIPVGVVASGRAAEIRKTPETEPIQPETEEKTGGYNTQSDDDGLWFMDAEKVAARARRGI